MADYELLFPSQYIKAAELRGKDVPLTIKRVDLANLPLKGTSDTKKRGVIEFQETDKKLVLNRTNADIIARLHGRDTEDWIGKRIALYPAMASFGRETVPAIRIRSKAPPAKGAAANTATDTTEGDTQ